MFKERKKGKVRGGEAGGKKMEGGIKKINSETRVAILDSIYKQKYGIMVVGTKLLIVL